MRYDVDERGDLSNGVAFADLTDAPGDDAIDGIKVDAAGNVYACGPGGIWVLSPAGERLAVLRLPEEPHNLAWGGDERTLYVTAMTSIYRLRLKEVGR
jgi:gluconolactonase